jgi:CRISPR-associated endonuclease Cas2
MTTTTERFVKKELTLGKLSGASPASDRYYVVVLFDISEAKKYRALLKILKGYGCRIQKSVFEAHLKRSQIKEMTTKIEMLMESERFYNPNDNVRIYRIAGNCALTVFGSYQSNIQEENIFI